MPTTTFAGHPLHPQLVEVPLGLLPFSFVMDLMFKNTGKHAYADAAYYAMVGGVGGALAAATAGAFDFFTLPRDSQARRIGRVHGLLNLGLVTLYGANLALRSGRKRYKDRLAPVLMSGIGAGGLAVSAWFGGELVYGQGMRVKKSLPLRGMQGEAEALLSDAAKTSSNPGLVSQPASHHLHM